MPEPNPTPDVQIPTDVRPEKVNELVLAAVTGMTAAMDKDVSTNEFFSAGMSVAARFISTGLEMGADVEALRGGVLKLWEMLPKEKIQ